MRLKCILTCAMVLAGAACQAAEVGAKAPSCELPTLSPTRSVDPAAFAGKVVYLDFWASWCGPCAKSFPFLEQLHRDLEGQGLEVVAVNLDETRTDADSFLAKHPVSFTIGLDPQGKCPRRYAVKGMPTTYLIDRQGRVQIAHEGFETRDASVLRQHVEALLAKP